MLPLTKPVILHRGDGERGVGVPSVMKDYHKRPALRNDNHNKSNLGSGIHFITGLQSPGQQN